MGYTHYWNQSRSFSREEWSQIRSDFEELKDVQHVQGIPLGNGSGEPGTAPEISDSKIWFNGVGDDSRETFCLNRVRRKKQSWQSAAGNDFCKTARKPYDLAVTAALCYLTTVPDPAAFTASSDGYGKDFLDGLAEARRALPRYANILDIPMDVMRSDRWCGPWVKSYELSGFDVNFCVDGKGSVENIQTGEWYCFETHLALAQYLDAHKSVTYRKPHRVTWHEGRTVDFISGEPTIWNPMGTFDKARHDRLAHHQRAALLPLFPPDPEHAQKPPAYVRPGDMPDPATRAYYLEDLLAL